MKEMKYVVVKVKDEPEQIYVFEKIVNHNEFAEVLSYMKTGPAHNWRREFREVVSAGFTDGRTCWGESESLNIKSRPTIDTAMLLGTKQNDRSTAT